MTSPDATQDLTADDIANMPGDQLLRHAVAIMRDELGAFEDAADQAIAALFDAGARAYRSDDPAEHRAVTYALVEMARTGLRNDAEPAGSAT